MVDKETPWESRYKCPDLISADDRPEVLKFHICKYREMCKLWRNLYSEFKDDPKDQDRHHKVLQFYAAIVCIGLKGIKDAYGVILLNDYPDVGKFIKEHFSDHTYKYLTRRL
jgi:hypothetical protein